MTLEPVRKSITRFGFTLIWLLFLVVVAIIGLAALIRSDVAVASTARPFEAKHAGLTNVTGHDLRRVGSTAIPKNDFAIG